MEHPRGDSEHGACVVTSGSRKPSLPAADQARAVLIPGELNGQSLRVYGPIVVSRGGVAIILIATAAVTTRQPGTTDPSASAIRKAETARCR